jgi:superfamily II DNA/RNA helicase
MLTVPDYGLRSVDAYLNRKFPDAISITMDGMHNARHSGLEDGSKTIWNEMDDNKERMKRLVDVLKLDRGEVGVDGRGLKGEKVMIFLNTVKDVDGATNGLRRAGIDAVPYHAKISLDDRTSNLEKFRLYRAPGAVDVDGENNTINGKNTVPVLVCTDVASRGLDIPGVTAIVQLQFALNVVSHLHRMGRCGRAGNRDGRGIIFYGSKERELVEVVREAEDQQARMTLKQDVEDDSDDRELESDGIDSKNEDGKVQKAFSRRRGFTKKRKNQRRKAFAGESEYDD